MHIQTVDRDRPEYKVFLEQKGERSFEPVGEIPQRIVRTLHARVLTDQAYIEDEWAVFMYEQRWLDVKLHGTTAILTAYPNTHNSFVRTLDLRAHFPGIPERIDQLKPEQLVVNTEFAFLELWPELHESRRGHVKLRDILWTGSR